MNKNERGFTLIEVLVVVAILGVLMGLVSFLVVKGRAKGEDFQTEQLITMHLPTAIERYKREMGEYPPVTIKGLQRQKAWKEITCENEINLNAELLWVALRHPDLSAPLAADDLGVTDVLQNRDEDVWSDVPAGGDDEFAWELCDAYGNTIVYIDKNHYDRPVTITNYMGESVEVTALKKPNGQWYNPDSFQIISIGPDGKQDEPDQPVDLGDDIMNFKKQTGE